MSDLLHDLLNNRRVFIILGPYGSGKTEFAINLALHLSRTRRKTALCDLDIVNPYFRSREREDLLVAHGIRLISSPRHTTAGEVPAVPGEVWAVMHDPDLTSVLDVGGDPVGARVLAAFSEPLSRLAPTVWYVLNRARMGPVSAHEALSRLRLVEAYSGLSITGIVNNTHLLHETDGDILRAGAAFAAQVAELGGIPVEMHALRADLVPQAQDLGPLFPMTLYMNRPWEQGTREP